MRRGANFLKAHVQALSRPAKIFPRRGQGEKSPVLLVFFRMLRVVDICGMRHVAKWHNPNYRTPQIRVPFA